MHLLPMGKCWGDAHSMTEAQGFAHSVVLAGQGMSPVVCSCTCARAGHAAQEVSWATWTTYRSTERIPVASRLAWGGQSVIPCLCITAQNLKRICCLISPGLKGRNRCRSFKEALCRCLALVLSMSMMSAMVWTSNVLGECCSKEEGA